MLTAEGCQQIRSLLWQAVLACSQEAAAVSVVTEADGSRGPDRSSFWMLTGPGLGFLLTMEMPEVCGSSALPARGPWAGEATGSVFYRVRLTDDRSAMQSFIRDRGLAAPPKGWLRANSSLQSAVWVRFLGTLTQSAAILSEWERQEHQESDRGLATIAEAILQEQELPLMINRSLEDLCRRMQVDRAVVYQIQARLQSIRLWRQEDGSSLPARWDDPDWQQASDCVTYEVRSRPEIPSLLYVEAEGCFVEPIEQRLQSIQREPWLINDAGPDRVARAQLAVPILAPIHGEISLWGVLVLHQCDRARAWSHREIELAKHTALGLAVALRVSHLDTNLQQQQQLLGRQLSNQNRALHEALLAAQSAARAKSEFLAAISHELRTPLTCVIGLSATLLRWSFGQLNQKQRDYLQTIHDSGEHLLRLIEDLLDMSQVEAGRTVLEISEFSISQLVYSLVNDERPRAAQRGVELLVDMQISPKVDRFSADYQRVAQILSNLLGNAIKFTPEGGQAIVRVWRAQDLLVLQIEDTGIGIPEEWLPHLFEMFHQLDPSYGRTYEGLGLGLALTKQLVDLHKGWIEVDSLPNKGSTFTVGIPCQSVATDQPAATDEADSLDNDNWRPSGSVILIDAQEDRAIAVCELLMAAGYQVVWTPDGAIALSQLDVLQPQVAIVSLRLPGTGMDGWEAVAGLRRQAPDVQVLLLGDRAEASSVPLHHPNLMVDVVLGDHFDPECLLHEVNGLARAAARTQKPIGQGAGMSKPSRSKLN